MGQCHVKEWIVECQGKYGDRPVKEKQQNVKI